MSSRVLEQNTKMFSFQLEIMLYKNHKVLKVRGEHTVGTGSRILLKPQSAVKYDKDARIIRQ